jgi:hypothetical protein
MDEDFEKFLYTSKFEIRFQESVIKENERSEFSYKNVN